MLYSQPSAHAALLEPLQNEVADSIDVLSAFDRPGQLGKPHGGGEEKYPPSVERLPRRAFICTGGTGGEIRVDERHLDEFAVERPKAGIGEVEYAFQPAFPVVEAMFQPCASKKP